jgi:hypothetical protein
MREFQIIGNYRNLLTLRVKAFYLIDLIYFMRHVYDVISRNMFHLLIRSPTVPPVQTRVHHLTVQLLLL